MNRNLTSITVAQAAHILDKAEATIWNAIKRGSLVCFPETGRVQHLAREQVELFKGRKRVILGDLSAEKLALWQEITDAINPPAPTHTPALDIQSPEMQAILKQLSPPDMQSFFMGAGMLALGAGAISLLAQPSQGNTQSSQGSAEVPQGNFFSEHPVATGALIVGGLLLLAALLSNLSEQPSKEEIDTIFSSAIPDEAQRDVIKNLLEVKETRETLKQITQVTQAA